MTKPSTISSGSPLNRLTAGALEGGFGGVRDVLVNGLTWRARRVRHRLRRIRSAIRAHPSHRRVVFPIRRARAAARVPVARLWATQPPGVRRRINVVRTRLKVATGHRHSASPEPGQRAAQPRVAVIVAASNRSELIGVTLRSIQLQTLADWECIVVDDGSLDDTLFVVQDFAEVDQRFMLLRHDRQRGAAAARNTGVAHATAPWLCFIDDDDFLLDGSLEARLAAVEEQPDDVVGAFCDWVNVDPDAGLERFRTRRSPVRRGTITYAHLVDGVPFIISSPLVRTSTIRAIGGFDEALQRAEDADLWFRLLRLGYRVLDARHLGVAYRRSVGSLVTSDPGAQLESMIGVFERADQPAPEIVGAGPLPCVEPLTRFAAEMARLVPILRYVALVAARDESRALQIGRQHLSALVRRSIDVEELARPLANHVAARLVDLSESDVGELEVRIENLLRALHPEPASDWQRRSRAAHDPGRLSDACLRAREAGAMRRADEDVRDLVVGSVVLIAEARYHVDELGPLADELVRRGVKVCFMESPKTIASVRRELAAYDHPFVSYSVDEALRAAAIISLNDWGPIRDLMERASERGIPTFAKVEGVQDFDDLDTGRVRRAYRTADVILGQGENDATALADRLVRVVGSTRLEQIWKQPAVRPGDHALVNSNFTYGVLTDQRDRWMSTVAVALDAAGVRGLVSRHPAERGDVHGLNVAQKPFRLEITKAGCLISRFSTVPFESMARGVPFVYYNPHGERVPTFTVPGGAFPVARTALELEDALSWALARRDDYRELATSFFLRQVDVDRSRSSEQRTADVVCEML